MDEPLQHQPNKQELNGSAHRLDDSRRRISLSRALLNRSLPTSILLISIFSIVILLFAREITKNQLEEKYQTFAQQIHDDIQRRIDSVREQTSILARNSLIVNSLIDVLQRDNYIPIFFRSVAIAGVDEASVYLVDYKGREIARNQTSIELESLEDSWKTSVLEQGNRFSSLTEEGLLIVEPIKIGEVPEGAIILWIDRQALNTLLAFKLFDIQWAWLDADETIIYSSKPDLFSSGMVADNNLLNDWYWQRYEYEMQPTKVIVAENMNSAFELTNRLLIAISLLALASILGVFIGVLITAKSAARTLKRFTTSVEEVKNNSDLKSFIAPQSDTEEIASLGMQVADLLLRIDESTVSRLYVERVLNSMNELLITTDRSGVIKSFNSAAKKMLNDCEHQSEINSSRFFVDETALAGESQSLVFESDLTLADGGKATIRWQRSLLRNEHMDVSGYLFLGTDISMIRIIESQLRLKEQAIEGAPSGIVISDAFAQDLPIIYSNKSFLEITGYSMRDVIGKNCRFLQGKDTDPEMVADIRMAIERRESFQGVILNYKKDGSPFYNELIISPVVNTDGQISHYLGVTVDVTKRVKTEQELREAKKKAEVANEAKSQFLANMSHEIRTPLNGVIGMTNLLKSTELSDIQQQYVGTLHESGKSLLSLINDILDYSKIEAGKIQIDTIEFHLSQLLESVIAILSIRASEKRVELNYHVDSSLSDDWIGDPGRIKQVLMNLVSNAIKFTDKGSVLVKVSPVLLNEHTLLQFEIIDTGIGIPSERIPFLFQRFEQVDSSRTRRYGGTGLGLAISKRLVEMMGGNIFVESEHGIGSKFTFTLDVQPDQNAIQPLPAAKLKNVKCLVVDSENAHREEICSVLEQASMDVISQSSGKQTLAFLNEQSVSELDIQVVIVDMVLSDMSGESLAMQLMQQADTRATKYLMMTSAGQREDAVRLRETGFSGYLSRPFAARDVIDVLQWALAERSQEDWTPFFTKHWINEHRHRIGAEILNSRSEEHGLKSNNDPLLLEGLHLDDKSILLVEDNKVNQLVIREYVKKTHAHCDIANHGKEALDLLEHKQFDLILMDMQMPEMDGIEATEIIRQTRSQKELPIIALTANVLEKDRQTCFDVGMNDYLSKPLDTSELARVLNKHLISS